MAMEAKVNFWDIAPAVLIVQEAGGLVTDLHGNPVTTDSTTFLATNGLLHEKMVQYFK